MGLAAYDLTYWLPYRKGQTDRFLPEPRWLKELYYKRPYWYCFAFALNAQQTLEYRQAARNDTRMVSIVGAAFFGVTPIVNGFQMRVFDPRRKRYMSPRWLDQANAVGVGSYRYYLRTPYRFRSGDTIVVEVKNLTFNALAGQVVLEGVEDVNPTR